MTNDMLEKLNTEQQNPNTWDIDVCSTAEILQKINEEDKKIALVVESQIPAITALVDKAYEAISKGGRIIYAGAGTSGRLGILDASECPPTYGVSDELVQGIIAGGFEAIFKAQEGAEDSKELARKDLKERGLNANDIVIGLAASG
ncbi:MAG: N-acetylmuramic acid 6-phosphate etherase, partial [Erysipelotrichaceae bacterium]|nr:N-acetylmuramic acid 6-phosphate etherase [Erysipelotrichaceae bacterium]